MTSTEPGSSSSLGWIVSRLAVLLVAGLLAQTCKRAPARVHDFAIDTEIAHQTIEGFGTSITTWVPPIVAFYERPRFDTLYLEELGASVLRIDLWHGSSLVEQAEWRNISRRDFTFDGPGERGGTFVRVAERLHQRSRGAIKIIASVWSPPAWMKVNSSAGNRHSDRRNYGLSLEQLQGRPETALPEEQQRYLLENKLRPDRYHHFAKTLVEWTRLFRERGVPLYAIGPQNEPRFSHWFASSVYTPEELAKLVQVVAWMFAHEGEPMPRLYGPETMTGDTEGNRLYLQALFATPGAGERMHALASHGYVDGYQTEDDPAAALSFRRLAAPYGKPVWVTEGGTGSHAWPAALHGLGVSLMNSLTLGNAALIAPWQVVTAAADEHSLMPLTGPTKKTFVAMQFFRFIRPGMRRVELTGESAELRAVAFTDPTTSKLIVVIVNRSPHAETARFAFPRPAAYRVREGYLTDQTHDCALFAVGGPPPSLAIPAQAVVTLVLESEGPATRK